MKAILAALLTLTACTPAGAQESVEMPQAGRDRAPAGSAPFLLLAAASAARDRARCLQGMEGMAA